MESLFHMFRFKVDPQILLRRRNYKSVQGELPGAAELTHVSASAYACWFSICHARRAYDLPGGSSRFLATAAVIVATL
jgi:hypothetical protein